MGRLDGVGQFFRAIPQHVEQFIRLFGQRKLPLGDHVVRVVRPKDVQDGQLVTTAFQPRPGEHYLSVSWLDYLKRGASFPDGLSLLRANMVANADRELKLQKSGRLAVLPVTAITGSRVKGWRWGRLQCRYQPRVKNVLPHGEGQTGSKLCDPHSAIFTVPWKGAELLSVQQYLLSKVVHQEASKL